jgi:hypothetical protein
VALPLVASSRCGELWGQENRPLRPVSDRQLEQFTQLPADRDPSGLPRLAGRLVLFQDDGVGGPVDVGNRRPAELDKYKSAEICAICG